MAQKKAGAQPTKADLHGRVKELEVRLDEIADISVDQEGDPEELLDEIADVAEEDEAYEDEGGEEDGDGDGDYDEAE